MEPPGVVGRMSKFHIDTKERHDYCYSCCCCCVHVGNTTHQITAANCGTAQEHQVRSLSERDMLPETHMITSGVTSQSSRTLGRAHPTAAHVFRHTIYKIVYLQVNGYSVVHKKLARFPLSVAVPSVADSIQFYPLTTHTQTHKQSRLLSLTLLRWCISVSSGRLWSPQRQVCAPLEHQMYCEKRIFNVENVSSLCICLSSCLLLSRQPCQTTTGCSSTYSSCTFPIHFSSSLLVLFGDD